MAKVDVDPVELAAWRNWLRAQFAAPEGSTLAGAARTDDPPAVPMSGGAEPAGAAKHSETHADR